MITGHVDGLKRPHVLLVVADDLGFNDVGYHNPEMRTPTIDKLAGEGVKLENYYVQPICSPSRSQLLSGRYQIHTGLQHGVIRPPVPNGLPLEDKTIADHMKAAGYATHMVGKWHIGYYKKEYTPTYRGFDSFFGYLIGAEDYYKHTRCYGSSGCGLDLHHNLDVVWNNTEYSTYLFTRKAENIIKSHDQSKPMFLYLPYQAVHGPLEVPEKYTDMYPHIKNKKRRTYAGMVSCMDEGLKNITNTLKQTGMWNNTIVIFTTDNGGQPLQGGNNWPLRGKKMTLWEGGLHGIGFVSSPHLKQHVKGSMSTELIHITDWYPTLLHLAGSNVTKDGLDGYDQWNTINNGGLSERKELLHNIDPVYSQKGHRLYPNRFDTRIRAAIRVGDWKLITGDPGDGRWFPLPNKYSNITDDLSKDKQNLWLFDIQNDPNEHKDLSKLRPDKVKLLLERLSAYNATAVPCRNPDADPNAAPSKHGGAWGPWM